MFVQVPSSQLNPIWTVVFKTGVGENSLKTFVDTFLLKIISNYHQLLIQTKVLLIYNILQQTCTIVPTNYNLANWLKVIIINNKNLHIIDMVIYII